MVKFDLIRPSKIFTKVNPKITYTPSKGIVAKASMNQIFRNSVASRKLEIVQNPWDIFFRWQLYGVTIYLIYKYMVMEETYPNNLNVVYNFIEHYNDPTMHWNSLENRFEHNP